MMRAAGALAEETGFNLLDVMHGRHQLPAITIAGGCGNNSVANGKIRRRTGYDRVYVQSAAGDAGEAIGAAFVTWHRHQPRRGFSMDHAYWGTDYSRGVVDDLVAARADDLAAAGCTVKTIADEAEDAVPFMMQVFQIREEQRARIPAVTHVNGSGRLQTVNRATNPRYYVLNAVFEAKTGVPMVLNTSFNENEPVVCQPEEALACFLRTKMDVLVLDDTLIRRQPVVAAA